MDSRQRTLDDARVALRDLAKCLKPLTDTLSTYSQEELGSVLAESENAAVEFKKLVVAMRKHQQRIVVEAAAVVATISTVPAKRPRVATDDDDDAKEAKDTAATAPPAE